MGSAVPEQGWTDATCPVARAVDLVGDRWSLLIIRDAMNGAQSFTDLRDRLGIARNTLTDRLRRLVENGILTRTTAPSGKRRVYELTDAGLDLFTTVVSLRQWGERHTFQPREPRSALRTSRGHEISKLQVVDRHGDEVTATTSIIQPAQQRRP